MNFVSDKKKVNFQAVCLDVMVCILENSIEAAGLQAVDYFFAALGTTPV